MCALKKVISFILISRKASSLRFDLPLNANNSFAWCAGRRSSRVKAPVIKKRKKKKKKKKKKNNKKILRQKIIYDTQGVLVLMGFLREKFTEPI
jgi:hypothetical protein